MSFIVMNTDAGMIFLFVFHLILAGLMGIHSNIVGVSEVPVKTGESISIPCLYERRYSNYKKYLCKERSSRSCSRKVTTTDQPTSSSGRFSISDDKKQNIFTVTINDLRKRDTYYWCAVEKTGSDVKRKFQLSVTDSGMPSLYVEQQEITAFERGSVTVRCNYTDEPVTKWCRLNGSCVGQTGRMDGIMVSINASIPGVFNVTMSELTTESSGWYLFVSEHFQMPVHITVQNVTTTTPMISSTANFTETLPTTTQLSSLPTRDEPQTTQPTNSSFNGTGGESLQEHKSSTMIILITTLILVCLVFLAVFLGWMLKIRRNKTKPLVSDVTADSHIENDPDLHYATIVPNQHAAAQQKKNISEETVTYSSIARKMAEPLDGSVIYSNQHSKTE